MATRNFQQMPLVQRSPHTPHRMMEWIDSSLSANVGGWAVVNNQGAVEVRIHSPLL